MNIRAASNVSEVPGWLKALVSLSVLVAAIVIGAYVWVFSFELSSNHGTWGQFGDYIGGTLNPLFAITALLALLYTIVLQSRELRYSAEQLKKSALALDKQNSVLTKQSFEATFFQLLRLYNEVIQELNLTEEVPVGPLTSQVRVIKHDDRECILYLYNVLRQDYLNSVNRGDSIERRLEALDSAYQEFYSVYGHLIGHYFRTIYNIVKIVDKADMPYTEKCDYTNILRAQLSKYELGLLLYNCLSKYGREKMLLLVNRYNLLKHIEDDVQLKSSDIVLVKEVGVMDS